MNTLTKERVLEIIEKINNFETDGSKPFTVVGPAGNGERKPRIYCNGGCVGWIGYPGKSNCELLDPDYVKYLPDEEKEVFNQMVASKGSECNSIIDSDKYLTAAFIATKNKHRKVSGELKERDVQVKIVKEFMNNPGSGWHIMDMETSLTKSMVPNSAHIKKVKKPDIVVLDKSTNEFGLIELKYNNDSTDNFREHYDVSKEVFDNPENTIKELCRRAEIMTTFGLIDDYIVKNKDSIISTNKIWFGFLFVGGGKSGAVDITKKHLSVINVSDACRFLYVDTIEELHNIGLLFSKMQDYKLFVS